MKLFKRKAEEIFSILYRSLIFPFKRMAIEAATKSIMLPKSYLRNTELKGRNYIGKNTVLKGCNLGYGSYVNNNGDLTDTDIGRYTSIGANVSTVIGKHPLKGQLAMHPAFTCADNVVGFSYTEKTTFDASTKRTEIGNDVWIGNNVLIMGGVKIADGSVIGAGSVVTKDTKPYSINAGVPAKTIRYRFDEDTVDKLLSLKWWEKDEKWIRENIDSFEDAEGFLK